MSAQIPSAGGGIGPVNGSVPGPGKDAANGLAPDIGNDTVKSTPADGTAAAARGTTDRMANDADGRTNRTVKDTVKGTDTTKDTTKDTKDTKDTAKDPAEGASEDAAPGTASGSAGGSADTLAGGSAVGPADGTGGTAGYAAGRTLPLRVEIVRQLRRRRTMVMFGLLLALPWILVIAFEVGPAGRGQGGLRLSDLATASGLNFAAFALSASASFLLVVAVALFCGDTVASEASWSSLRYLLAAPVSRDRLLRQKLIVALGFSAAGVICLPLMALLAGTLAFGWNDITIPGTGETIPALTVLPRFGIVIAYALISQLVVAALAFLLSVSTDSPLGAVGGAVGLVIISNIIQAVDALGSLREFLPTFWNTAWLDALALDMDWSGMIKGASVSVTYAAILIAFAFRRFRRKDVVS